MTWLMGCGCARWRVGEFARWFGKEGVLEDVEEGDAGLWVLWEGEKILERKNPQFPSKTVDESQNHQNQKTFCNILSIKSCAATLNHPGSVNWARDTSSRVERTAPLSNGGTPTTSVYNMQPSDHTSDDNPYGRLDIISLHAHSTCHTQYGEM